ncbi:hypothetical protein AVEN_6057-1 [Araneus ventricosus]|uniref:Uncharacterized protein n=1 Tax=Araneus ventricosus TaxID=182803 RepID=A0A4Y2G0H4_ARAVE|nr:hypothetical protein AVEN_6057-1 [Araneus ventricosus]
MTADMFQHWLFPQIQQEQNNFGVYSGTRGWGGRRHFSRRLRARKMTSPTPTGRTRIDLFIFMQDGAPPHFHHEVQQCQNDTILTLCGFFYLWGYIKDRVFVHPMPATLQD